MIGITSLSANTTKIYVKGRFVNSPSSVHSVKATAKDETIRVLGLYEAKMKVRDGKLSGKLGEMYNAVGRQFKLVAAESTQLPQALWFYNLASNFNRNRALWRAAATMNPTAFRMRTRLAEQKLQRWNGKYDMILQLHTLFAPGYSLSKQPYALVTDNTYLSSLRHWPEWVPAPTCNLRREWIELETEVYENAKYIFTWSEFTRQSFIHDYKMSPDKVVTVGGGSNLVAEDISTKSYDSQTAIFVGYEFERKGGQYLLESWHKVRQQLPNAKLYIVGPRSPVAPPQPGVYWLGRINDREVLREKYLESTCFVMPSLFEPFGHVFAEAMGLGLSCVGTNHCAMPEIINPGVTGLLAQPRDVDSLADALIAILGNPTLARTMGENAFKRVMTGGTWDDVVNRMAPHIQKIFEN